MATSSYLTSFKELPTEAPQNGHTQPGQEWSEFHATKWSSTWSCCCCCCGCSCSCCTWVLYLWRDNVFACLALQISAEPPQQTRKLAKEVEDCTCHKQLLHVDFIQFCTRTTTTENCRRNCCLQLKWRESLAGKAGIEQMHKKN